MTRRHLRRTQIGFDRAVHEIVTAGAVRMNIYESGGDPIAAGIGNQSGIPLIVTFADSRDHTAVPLHIAPARCRGTMIRPFTIACFIVLSFFRTAAGPIFQSVSPQRIIQ